MPRQPIISGILFLLAVIRSLLVPVMMMTVVLVVEVRTCSFVRERRGLNKLN